MSLYIVQAYNIRPDNVFTIVLYYRKSIEYCSFLVSICTCVIIKLNPNMKDLWARNRIYHTKLHANVIQCCLYKVELIDSSCCCCVMLRCYINRMLGRSTCSGYEDSEMRLKMYLRSLLTTEMQTRCTAGKWCGGFGFSWGYYRLQILQYG